MRWMMSALLLVGLSVSSAPSAWAQDHATGDEVFMVSETRSERFADADHAGPTFRDAESVTVLYVEGDRVRVRKGDRFGWVDATKVTADSPVVNSNAPAFDTTAIELSRPGAGALPPQ